MNKTVSVSILVIAVSAVLILLINIFIEDPQENSLSDNINKEASEQKSSMVFELEGNSSQETLAEEREFELSDDIILIN